VKFADTGTEDVYNGIDSKAARRACPSDVVPTARRKLAILAAAAVLADIALTPGSRLEALKGDRKGQHSIRINDQYRVCFRWTGDEPEGVEIVDYH